jgi:hypothetical protein
MTEFDPGADTDGDGVPDALDGFDDRSTSPSSLEVGGVQGSPEPAGTMAPGSPGTPPPEPPSAPVRPSADADPAAWNRYHEDLERYNQMMQMYSNIVRLQHDTIKAIVDNVRS